MTTYEQLAHDMTAAGIKGASTSKARDLAERSMYGADLTDIEQHAIKIWEARAWIPEQRKTEAK